MKQVQFQVYDPPMCCSTGVCGPNPDPELVRFASDLEWLRKQGVAVERFNLSSDPSAFTSQEKIKKALEEEGSECLPVVLVNGTIVSKSVYPSRSELLKFIEAQSEGLKIETPDDRKETEK